MMNVSGVSGKGKQEIKKHLKAHLRQGFCPSRRCVGMLSQGHGVVNYDCINFTYKGKQQEEFKFCNREFVEKLSKARKMVTDQQLKLKTMRTSKVKDQQSIETKIFKVLKKIGVELSSYHWASLNGKDIRKVMTNACYIFDTFATIFKAGKRPNCMLSDTKNINALCMQFREVFVLWDGAFSLARTINPTEIDCSTYRMYVRAAVKGSKDLRCTVTPKVHL